MKHIVLIAFIFFTFGLFCQPDLGRGFLRGNLRGLPVYDSPHGQVIGAFYEQTYAAEGQNIFVLLSRQNNDSLVVDTQDVIEVEYDLFFIPFFNEQNEHYEILKNTIPAGAWVSKRDLQYFGYSVQNWFNFFASGISLFPESLGNTLTVFTEPNENSAQIGVLKDNSYEVRILGGKEGPWVEVQVVRHAGVYCKRGFGKELIQWTGWIKLFDDQGRPQLWFYPKGC